MIDKVKVFKETLTVIKTEIFTKKQIIRIMSTNEFFWKGASPKVNPYEDQDYKVIKPSKSFNELVNENSERDW